LTEGRETINRDLWRKPPSSGSTAVHNGFVSYSEGCNDDVNSTCGGGLGWNPDTDPHDILREYGRFFISTTPAMHSRTSIRLEQNWKAPLMSNTAVETTMRQFQELGSAVRRRQNAWETGGFSRPFIARINDAYLRERLTSETEQEHRSLGALDEAQRTGALNASGPCRSDPEGDALTARARNGERGLSNCRGTVSEHSHATQRGAISGDRRRPRANLDASIMA